MATALHQRGGEDCEVGGGIGGDCGVWQLTWRVSRRADRDQREREEPVGYTRGLGALLGFLQEYPERRLAKALELLYPNLMRSALVNPLEYTARFVLEFGL